MKQLTIKKRVVLWYAFVLMIVFIAVTAVILITGDRLARDGAKQNLITATDRALGDVRVVGGKLKVDDDVDYYSNGAYIIIYKDDGTIVSGLEMEGLDGKVDFEADSVREIKQDGASFYIYDRLIENAKLGRIWVRGMTSADLDVISPALWEMLRIFMFALPVILVLALLGGWYITRRAFLPLGEMNETADKIYQGRDLSHRIDIDDSKAGDEITDTARVFNKMLDGIEAAFESEKRFTNDASHELRTPTAVILGKAEYALQNTDDEEVVKEARTTIHEQSLKMSDLINKLLLLARADRDKITLNRELIDLGLTAEIAAAHFEEEAAEKNITVAVNAEDEVYFTGDMAFIERALENLISNGIKYGREGGRVDVSVEKRDGDNILIKVADDGVGINHARLPDIWERFYTVDETRDNDSLGLGLTLTKWIVEAHGGDISVESALNEGTCFSISLPCDPEDNGEQDK